MVKSPITLEDLQKQLRCADPVFWDNLRTRTQAAESFSDLISLATLRRRARAVALPNPCVAKPVRIAFLGGYNLYPLHELTEHFLECNGFDCEKWIGKYDNYLHEMTEPDNGLLPFQPRVTLVLPAPSCLKYGGHMLDSQEMVRSAAAQSARDILELCTRYHQKTGSEIILGNLPLPCSFDPGAFRTRSLATDWSYRKLLNLEIGAGAPPFVYVCDVEFLSYRIGGQAARDDRAWYETKQPGSPAMLVALAREIAHLVVSMNSATKKVLALDLDNTLWGGIIGDDGLEGIELGENSPRGEAFRDFQKYVKSLNQRGILLAVCSKNEHAIAIDAFRNHPEMILKEEDIASFQANWDPKPDNLRRIAQELNLGLDSLVFVDDNPAEIEIVRQFTPEVETIQLGPDPADYRRQLEDARFFEPRQLTEEDQLRPAQYRQEVRRARAMGSPTDMDSYLSSLEMKAVFRQFIPLDLPRVTQLINKSNQFNLTARRYTEAEVLALIQRVSTSTLSIRLSDRFGDYGLISAIIAVRENGSLRIDTWVMSCRVLNRQVEEAVANQLVRLAREAGCKRLIGEYIPTSRNAMVKDLYPRLGWEKISELEGHLAFALDVDCFREKGTRIAMEVV
jgi:FkbH-like protein